MDWLVALPSLRFVNGKMKSHLLRRRLRLVSEAEARQPARRVADQLHHLGEGHRAILHLRFPGFPRLFTLLKDAEQAEDRLPDVMLVSAVVSLVGLFALLAHARHNPFGRDAIHLQRIVVRDPKRVIADGVEPAARRTRHPLPNPGPLHQRANQIVGACQGRLVLSCSDLRARRYAQGGHQEPGIATHEVAAEPGGMVIAQKLAEKFDRGGKQVNRVPDVRLFNPELDLALVQVFVERWTSTPDLPGNRACQNGDPWILMR